ncbi:MAG: PQQ-dependent sugar dehydrogenase [Paracoccus sp. (in: a-proteobacteria)]|nr:PQQ-dependent sugar dehydrogenase [Paracoccus sp. (in: a-proteobacteria)]
MKPFLAAPLALIMVAGCAWAEPWPQGAARAGYEPAFAGQTRAGAMNSGVTLSASVVQDGLEHPWALAFLPDGGVLVTERPGRLRHVKDGRMTTITGIPPVSAGGQGGLLDVAVAPDFERSRVIFLSYAEPREGGNGTSVARMVLAPDAASVSDVRVIFRQNPTYGGQQHFGSRILPDADGTLFITLGDRSDTAIRETTQRLDNHIGKLVRINADGTVPADNPFAGQPGAAPEIWALGLRNVQAAAKDAGGRLWTVEHGPAGGDELNLIAPGRNYGWPVISYGVNYNGSPVNAGITQQEGMEQPVYYWDPVIAPSGAVFYEGAMFPEFRGDLLIGSLRPGGIVRLALENDRVSGEERFDPGNGIGRVRDIQVAGDGAIWIVTDAASGALYRLTRQE